MSDGSLDGDGGMNVCVCDVANDVVTDVGGGGVGDVVRWNDSFLAAWGFW